MLPQTIEPLTTLYEADETAWLDTMAALVRKGKVEELDFAHLAEYLEDMATRDRREVMSRLVVLLTHILKWSTLPEKRSRSWRSTIIEQRQELHEIAYSGVLRNHAENILERAYGKAVERAAVETGLSSDRWPSHCPYSVEQLLTFDLTADES